MLLPVISIPKPVLYIALFVVIFIIIYFAIKYFNPSFYSDLTNGGEMLPDDLPAIDDEALAEEETPCVLYFKKEKCPFCVEFNGSWDQVVKTAKADPKLNHVHMKVIKGDDESNIPKMEKYNVPGFPDIIFVTSNGEFKRYGGDRSAEDIVKEMYATF
jgi:thioredoxin-related protein